MPTLGQQPHLKALCKLVSMKKQQLAGFYPFFMPLLYKNTDSSDRSHDSLSFSKSIFSYESSNSLPQWAYLISPNPSSAVAYSCPHTKPNKFLILCSHLCIEAMSLLWQKK